MGLVSLPRTSLPPISDSSRKRLSSNRNWLRLSAVRHAHRRPRNPARSSIRFAIAWLTPCHAKVHSV
jgi:hypothetical protein